MLFYHLADIHLGACPDRGHPWSQQRAQQIYDSFYKVLERAHEEQADFVFICGDLFRLGSRLSGNSRSWIILLPKLHL